MSLQAQRRVIPIKPEPASSLTAAQRLLVLDVCARHEGMAGALLPILHAIQESLGFVPRDAVPLVAHALNLSLAELHGVITFYHYFKQERPGRHTVHLCRAEACQAVGAMRLETHAKQSLGIDYHGTTADGAVTLEPVYCLGNCALGPSIMIDDRPYGRVTAARFDELMTQARAS